MRFFYSSFLLVLATLPFVGLAQQPFQQQFRVKAPMLTLSNGRYPEFFQKDSLRRIGSIIYDTQRHRIAYLILTDSLTGLSRTEITARWLSVDPLMAKYAGISPYVFSLNNPVIFNDPDGRDPHIARTQDSKGNTIITVTTTVVLVNQSKAGIDHLHQLNKQGSEILRTTSFDNGNGTTTTVTFNTNIVSVATEKEYKALDKQLKGATVKATFNEKMTGDKAYYQGDINFGLDLSAKSFFHEIAHDFGFADKYVEDDAGYFAVLTDYVNTLMGQSAPFSEKEARALAAGVNSTLSSVSGVKNSKTREAIEAGVYQPIDRDKDEIPIGSVIQVYEQESEGGALNSTPTTTTARPGQGTSQTRRMSKD